MTTPGRNDPCPCGSGKKYKRCCGVTTGKSDMSAQPSASIQGLLDLGLQLHKANRPAEALPFYEAVLKRQPHHADALHLMGLIALDLDHPEQAIPLIEQAIAQNGRSFAYYNSLGNALKAAGRPVEAVQAIRKSAALHPGSVEILTNLGAALHEAGEFEEAVSILRNALAHDGRFIDAHYCLANSLKQLGRMNEAEESYRRCIELEPARSDVHINLGNLLAEETRQTEAITCYRHAITLSPRAHDAHLVLANVLRTAGRYEESLDHYRLAIATQPDNPNEHHDLAITLSYLGQNDAALASYRRAVTLKPDFVDAHWNRALLLLLTGALGHGWDEYEWGWNPALREARQARADFPLWDGSPLAGRTILLTSEQGVGDEVMFAGLIPDLLRAGANCVLECAPRLAKVFERSFPNVSVRPKQDGPEQYPVKLACDVFAPTASLPRWLRRHWHDFGKGEPYLKSDPDRVAGLRARYLTGEAKRLVGISWRSGNPKNGSGRSIPLTDWAPILQTPGVRFINLQYGECEADLAELKEATGFTVLHDQEIDPLKDLDGFTSQVVAMDQVISIDNSTVHVAGALGVPTSVMLPHLADWRWFIEREDSPWYASLTLFRQSVVGDWGEVIERVGSQLHSLID